MRRMWQTQRAKAFELAEPGDIVLLSPANASWDMYANFEVRGDEFPKTVEELKNNMKKIVFTGGRYSWARDLEPSPHPSLHRGRLGSSLYWRQERLSTKRF